MSQITQNSLNQKTESELEQEWKNATLLNNFIFYKVMRSHPDACKKLIEMLLKIKIGKMEIRNEEIIDIDHDSKGIRLDVLVKEQRRMHDIELQVIDTKELPERSRYYAALMALDSLVPGDSYKKLRDSHVIFICMEDIFKKELPVYTFENICKEDGKTKLRDRDYKHFFIAPTCAKIIEDEEVRGFFEFLISNNPSTDYTKDLKDYVNDAKHNMQWRFQFMTWERIKTYAFEEGKEKGLQQKAEEAAIEFLKEGIAPETIAKCVKLPLNQVLELQKSITVTA